MVGHRLLGTSLLDGETEKAFDHLERATKLYDATADRATAVTYGTDVQITSLVNLAICCWLVGRLPEAVAYGRQALEYADQLSHAHTLGYAYVLTFACCTRWSGTYKRSGHSHSGRLRTRSNGSYRCGFRWRDPAAWRRGSTRWRSSAISCRRRTLSTGCPPTFAGSQRHISVPTSWRKPGFVSSRREMSSGGAVTTGTRSSAFVSKGGLPRIRKSMMRRSLKGTSSKRWRSPAGAANEDLPCARRTVLPAFSPPKARPNVHARCCKTNYNSSPISQIAAIAQMPKCYCAPSKEDLEADSVLKRAGVTLEPSQPQKLPNISRPCGARVSLRALAELAAELSQRPAVRHADSRHLQSQHRTDCKTGVHFCRTP